MGLSASKRVERNLGDSPEFDSACNSVYEECLNLSQHAFPGVRPYQLVSASENLHRTLSTHHPLIKNWVQSPPSRTQVDRALRVVTTDPVQEETLGPAQFKAFAVELFAEAVVSNAGKAVLCRIPIGIAGIAGIGMATRSGKDLVRAAIGVYALGVATSVYLSLSA